MFNNSFNLLKTTSGSTNKTIFQVIEDAHSNNLIDDFEYSSLKNLSHKIKNNYEETITDDELLDYVNNLKSEWESQGYTVNSNGGRIMAITLAISILSLNWWQKNGDTLSSPLGKINAAMLLPAWAGTDIAGATIGVITSGITQYSVNGSVDWSVIGVSALGGAVVGFTGIVGKVGEWLSGLF